MRSCALLEQEQRVQLLRARLRRLLGLARQQHLAQAGLGDDRGSTRRPAPPASTPAPPRRPASASSIPNANASRTAIGALRAKRFVEDRSRGSAEAIGDSGVVVGERVFPRYRPSAARKLSARAGGDSSRRLSRSPPDFSQPGRRADTSPDGTAARPVASQPPRHAVEDAGAAARIAARKIPRERLEPRSAGPVAERPLGRQGAPVDRRGLTIPVRLGQLLLRAQPSARHDRRPARRPLRCAAAGSGSSLGRALGLNGRGDARAVLRDAAEGFRLQQPTRRGMCQLFLDRRPRLQARPARRGRPGHGRA